MTKKKSTAIGFLIVHSAAAKVTASSKILMHTK